MTTRSVGQASEDRALEYVKQKGLRLLERNYNCRHGEIDLVMLDKDTLVFIEVRYRRSNHFGGALASITPRKQQHIQNTALHYLQRNPQYTNSPLRFDAVGIEQEMGKENITWVQNAFEASDT